MQYEAKKLPLKDGRKAVLRVPTPEDAPELAVGDHVTAYTTGIMTLSIPAQMNAVKIVLE